MLNAVTNDCLCTGHPIMFVLTLFAKVMVKANFIGAPSCLKESDYLVVVLCPNNLVRSEWCITLCPTLIRVTDVIYPKKCHNLIFLWKQRLLPTFLYLLTYYLTYLFV